MDRKSRLETKGSLIAGVTKSFQFQEIVYQISRLSFCAYSIADIIHSVAALVNPHSRNELDSNRGAVRKIWLLFIDGSHFRNLS